MSYTPVRRFMYLGKKDANGKDTFIHLLTNGKTEQGGALFAIYCRKCHYGLCMHIELGACMKSGRLLNVIFVDPCPNCGTGEIVPWPSYIAEEMG